MAVATARPEAHLFQEAVRLHLDGDAAKAADAYRALLRLAPNHAAASNNLGTILAQEGALDDARSHFQHAIALEADYGEAHNNLGLLCVESRDYAGAVKHFERAVRLSPRNAAWQNNLGNALVEVFRFADACVAYDQAVAADPRNADAWSNRGLALRGLREPGRAIESLEHALKLNPSHINALSNLGVILKEERRYATAIATLRRAIDLSPRHPALLANLASVYERTGDHEEVRRWAQRAVDVDPDYPESYNLLANMEMEAGRYDAAEALYLDVVRRDAHNRNANWNLALIWLLRGDFARGWKQFEWRKRLQAVVFDHGDYGPNEWSGGDLTGCTILLHSEQGMGDAIQFVRYVPLLKARGARQVIVECPLPIVSLLEHARGVDRVVPRGATLPPYDVHANLMSLPGALGTTLDTVPADVPYLAVAPRPVRDLVPRAPACLTVGFVWTGNPSHARDYLRSVPLERFLRLADRPGVRFVSLQKGDSAEAELAAARSPAIVNLAPHLADFRDTAAAIDALDLVISVDTSVAHLAGALGKTTWLLLPHVPDFRWMVERADSPWYPSMRLFRQATPRDWDPVFDAVERELDALAAACLTSHESPPPTRSSDAALPPAVAVHGEDLVWFSSAKTDPTGKPTFEMWVPLRELADPTWFADYQAELLGRGSEREVRAFLDEVLTHDYGFLDIAPGLGVTSIDVCVRGAAARPRRVVLVEPRTTNRHRLSALAGRYLPQTPIFQTVESIAAGLDALGDVGSSVIRVGDPASSEALGELLLGGETRALAVLWPAVDAHAIGTVLDRLTTVGYRIMALGFVDDELSLDALSDDATPPIWRHPGDGTVRPLVAVSPALWARLTAEPSTDSSPDAISRELGIDWEVRGDTGWGIYGLNLAVTLLRRRLPRLELFAVDDQSCSPLVRHVLRPAVDRARGRASRGPGRGRFAGIMLRALGNNLSHGPLWNIVRGRRNVGIAFIEDTVLDDDARARAATLDLIVAGSSWNETLLRASGIDNVTTVLQGVDPTVFHRAPRHGVLRDRFVLFSGGKLEYRKGQDIVVAAFREFRRRHSDALLLAAWHNNWPQLIVDMTLAGHTQQPPAIAEGGLDVVAWCVANGIPADAVVDIGHQPNALMGQFLREAHVALFPNRCEGGTNLVAMEAMACGIPTLVSANTGHRDLVSTWGCVPLESQRPVRLPTRYFRGVDDWGESDVEEILTQLERAYTSPADLTAVATRGADAMAAMSWDAQCAKLLDAIDPLWS
jgi:tetratricopeptide (TPR) repeat protein/glycosyltransferase involved in cell wall biosynthesis